MVIISPSLRVSKREWASFQVARESESSATSVTLHSNELLDMNVSSSFVELAIATAKVWSTEGDNVLQRARGSYPPYRISNRTGGALFIWSDIDGSRSASDYPAAKISSGETVDWRFDDWKSAREVSYQFQVFHAPERLL